MDKIRKIITDKFKILIIFWMCILLIQDGTLHIYTHTVLRLSLLMLPLKVYQAVIKLSTIFSLIMNGSSEISITIEFLLFTYISCHLLLLWLGLVD